MKFLHEALPVSGDWGRLFVFVLGSMACLGAARAEPLVTYAVQADSIPVPLTATPGDPMRGARLFRDRTVSTCLLCHAEPSAAQAAAIGPSIAGVGSRLDAGQIRLRIVDSKRLDPATIMPSFYATEGLTRVGRPWQSRPVLGTQQIEDMVAFLATLRDTP